MAPLSVVLAVVLTIVVAKSGLKLRWIAIVAFVVTLIGFYVMARGHEPNSPDPLAYGGATTQLTLVGVFLIIMGLFSCLTLCVIGIGRGLGDAAKISARSKK